MVSSIVLNQSKDKNKNSRQGFLRCKHKRTPRRARRAGPRRFLSAKEDCDIKNTK